MLGERALEYGYLPLILHQCYTLWYHSLIDVTLICVYNDNEV